MRYGAQLMTKDSAASRRVGSFCRVLDANVLSANPCPAQCEVPRAVENIIPRSIVLATAEHHRNKKGERLLLERIESPSRGATTFPSTFTSSNEARERRTRSRDSYVFRNFQIHSPRRGEVSGSGSKDSLSRALELENKW